MFAVEQRRLTVRKLVSYSARSFRLPAEGARALDGTYLLRVGIWPSLYMGFSEKVMPLFVLIQKRHVIKWRQP
jgi:hypothetical protein